MMASMELDDLYSRARVDLVRFATALVGPDDALDVVSEAVVTTLASGRLDGVDDVRAYWFRAVANRAASWNRSSGRRRRRDARSAALDRFSDVEVTADRARELLGGLSPQQRAVVYLTYWHDWDPATIAAALAVSEGTVRKQLARARAHLREVMNHEGR
jgi:RNA polymerase sigma factor (sigma-70 family)